MSDQGLLIRSLPSISKHVCMMHHEVHEVHDCAAASLCLRKVPGRPDIAYPTDKYLKEQEEKMFRTSVKCEPKREPKRLPDTGYFDAESPIPRYYLDWYDAPGRIITMIA